MKKLNEEQMSYELGFYKFKDTHLVYLDRTHLQNVSLDEAYDQYLIFVGKENLNVLSYHNFEEMLVKSGVKTYTYKETNITIIDN